MRSVIRLTKRLTWTQGQSTPTTVSAMGEGALSELDQYLIGVGSTKISWISIAQKYQNEMLMHMKRGAQHYASALKGFMPDIPIQHGQKHILMEGYSIDVNPTLFEEKRSGEAQIHFDFVSCQLTLLHNFDHGLILSADPDNGQQVFKTFCLQLEPKNTWISEWRVLPVLTSNAS